MRDVLSHHYWRRDAQVVMRTVDEPMDILAAACEQLLASSDPAAGANRPGLAPPSAECGFVHRHARVSRAELRTQRRVFGITLHSAASAPSHALSETAE